MTAKGFYRQLLRAKLAGAIGEYSTEVETFGSGALAAGLQISPLNDVDVVAIVPAFLPGWWETPQKAMQDVRSWVEPLIAAQFSSTTHAIKLKYPDEEFTADIVIGVRNGDAIVIPHLPDRR